MADQDVRGALRARTRMLAIAADPDLGPQAKLFALCALAYLADPYRCADARVGQWAITVGQMMIGRQGVVAVGGPVDGVLAGAGGVSAVGWEAAVEAVRQVIAADVPRYVIAGGARRCPVPKTRGKNRGRPCGRYGVHSWIDRDPDSGVGVRAVSCAAHYDPAEQAASRRRVAAWIANGQPSPPPNTGGLLARHFAADWAELYAWAEPAVAAAQAGDAVGPPRPRLRLIRGGGEGAAGAGGPGPLALREQTEQAGLGPATNQEGQGTPL